MQCRGFTGTKKCGFAVRPKQPVPSGVAARYGNDAAFAVHHFAAVVVVVVVVVVIVRIRVVWLCRSSSGWRRAVKAVR